MGCRYLIEDIPERNERLRSRADSPGGVRSESKTANANGSRTSLEKRKRRVRGC